MFVRVIVDMQNLELCACRMSVNMFVLREEEEEEEGNMERRGGVIYVLVV